jgi:hypothetical protein
VRAARRISSRVAWPRARRPSTFVLDIDATVPHY